MFDCYPFLIVEDGNCLTELAAIAIVHRKDQPAIDWVIACLKKHHIDAAHNIKYFMCDKNATQRSSVNKIFPECMLLICLFHVIQIFKRELAKMILTRKQKEFCPKILNEIACLNYISQYKKFLQIIEEKFPVIAADYFMINWHPIKHQWTCHAENTGTSGIRTNNRSESLNQK